MKRLYRSRRDRRICGLCGGLAEYFNIDPTIVRVGVVAAFVLTGFLPVFVAYFLAAIIVPNDDDMNIIR